MTTCEAMNCGYYYQGEDDNFPCCHYDDPWPAPCEHEDEDDYQGE